MRPLLGESVELPMFLGGYTFAVSPAAFFQVNSAQAEVLLRVIRDGCALAADRSDTLLDLFCGTGALGLCLAAGARALHGFEVVPQAVANARANAAANGISNATFTCADLAAPVVPAAVAAVAASADVVLVDPARAGLSAPLVGWLRRSLPAARRLVYVSCNPVTQARDLRDLCAAAGADGGQPWKLEHVQPVDMFPLTAAVEAVAVLVRQ